LWRECDGAESGDVLIRYRVMDYTEPAAVRLRLGKCRFKNFAAFTRTAFRLLESSLCVWKNETLTAVGALEIALLSMNPTLSPILRSFDSNS
jgi:hypothetical protein